VGGCVGPWRVERGLVRLDRDGRSGPLLVMLAEPGDWLGLDVLAGQPHGWRATAVTPVTLRGPLQPASDDERARWLTEALLQQPERAHAMALLRTGSVRQRLAALLRLLARPDVLGDVEGLACLRSHLPPLRVLAELVDAKHETVCRVLGELLPREPQALSGAAGLPVGA
ncbi:MAG: hypothetical protein P3W97_010960, partial [Tepidimonas sp.]|uniref:hypothetical protein n=1 Tax=Tepidimonas sp. TaxID=2002775 RepID=UPI00259D8BE6